MLFWNSMTIVSDYKMRLLRRRRRLKGTFSRKGVESIGHQVRDDLKNFTPVYLGAQTLGKILYNVNCLSLKRFPVDSGRGFH